jgi:hypothetical protein
MKTILGILASTPVVLLGLGWGAINMSPPDYQLTRGLFTGATVSAVIWYIFWLFVIDEPVWLRACFGAGIGIIALGGLPYALVWADHREEIALAKTKQQANSGIIESTPTLLFAPNGTGMTPKLQIGDSNVFLIGPSGYIGMLLFPALTDAQFKIEAINGKMKVSIVVADDSGKPVVELIRNDWNVSPDRSWDRNYSNEALEVKDSSGTVILQVRALPDRFQIQGAWWVDMGPPNGFVHMFIWKDPSKSGAQITFVPKNSSSPPPRISPIFEYPSDRHLGQLRADGE